MLEMPSTCPREMQQLIRCSVQQLMICGSSQSWQVFVEGVPRYSTKRQLLGRAVKHGKAVKCYLSKGKC